MIVVSVLLGAIATVFFLPLISDLMSLVKATVRRPGPQNAGGERPRLLFLVPAHDEELLIRQTLRSLAELDYPPDRYSVAVVADNCADGTARIVRAAGVPCLERTDPVRRGKPWAIEWALARLPVSDHDAVVIVDADAILDPGYALALAAAAPLREKAVQGYNGVNNPEESPLTRMGALFSSARCRFMNPLKHRAGLNSPLANGLCIGSGVLARHGWTAYSICEDWELYALLTQEGVAIESVPRARVYSQEARTLRQSSSQRQRWAAGRLVVLAEHLLPVLRSRRIGVHQKLDVVAELAAPGPVVHFGIAAGLAAAAPLLGVPYAGWISMALLGSLLRPVAYTLLAVGVDPHPRRAALAFTYLPVYTVWRLGVQLRVFTRLGGGSWVRTQRHDTARTDTSPEPLTTLVEQPHGNS